ncbi:MAG: M3 family metallopeptidase [Prevotellaceae bacterium]|jgi:peptidyl-dipeptidase Dcp|nr:M3 family metallopeptidase [Prevotellaceae bacterium]
MILHNNKRINPLLTEWNTPFQTPPFELINDEHYLPAFRTAIASAESEIKAIVENNEKSGFENTVVALELAGKQLKRISNVFFNLEEAETNDTLQAIAQEVSPLLTKFENDLYLNEKLFAKIKKVKENVAEQSGLTGEQKMLLDKTYSNFVRNGANLSEADKLQFREISEQLALLSLTFGQNVLAATNAYSLHITDEKDIKGLPDGIADAAHEEAKTKKLDGWLFTLHQPSYASFLKYADNRELREKIYRAYNSKATSGDKSNLDIVKQISNLRLKMANLLGYKSYAEFSLEKTMAKNIKSVDNLLNSLIIAAKPVAKNELSVLQKFAESQGSDFKIMPWDLSYYSEKLKTSKYQLDDEMTRPYFRLENVVEGAFKLSNILYGLNYELRTDLTLYHPDVKAYKVTDENDKLLALLYLDFFPRDGKRNGAWMTNFREQSNVNGNEQRPIVSLVCNFTKPTESKPSLLTFNEVETFLHEFGHGLHGMLSETTYESLAGTNVYRDFVELPSQIMENFCVEKEFLDIFAQHYLTGEKIPSELVDRIVKSRNFMEGYATMRQLNFARLDMAYHTQETPLKQSIFDFENEATKETKILPDVDNDLISASFAHIFSGGYAAGYYSYKWSETLDADAFSVFKKNGVFDKTTAESFKNNILTKGGTEDPMKLYVNFRKQEPSIEALLVRSGLLLLN